MSQTNTQFNIPCYLLLLFFSRAKILTKKETQKTNAHQMERPTTENLLFIFQIESRNFTVPRNF